MQLYWVGNLKYDIYLKYDNGHNLFTVEDRFHVDMEQIHDGFAVIGIAPWENNLP